MGRSAAQLRLVPRLEGAAAEVSFIVPGNPIPQPKPRTQGFKRFYPKRYTDYTTQVVDVAQTAAAELHGRGTPWDAHRERYGLRVRFYRETAQRCDLDRLVATAFDSLVRAGMLKDDMLFKRLRAEVDVDRSRPRLELTLEVLG